MARQQEVDEVCRLISQGARLFVARDASGRHRIKLKTGPFGLLTKRYTLSFEQMEQIKRDFDLDRD